MDYIFLWGILSHTLLPVLGGHLKIKRQLQKSCCHKSYFVKWAIRLSISNVNWSVCGRQWCVMEPIGFWRWITKIPEISGERLFCLFQIPIWKPTANLLLSLSEDWMSSHELSLYHATQIDYYELSCLNHNLGHGQ